MTWNSQAIPFLFLSVVLEILAVPVPGFGWVTAHLTLALGALLHPELGPRLALGVLGMQLFSRLLRPRPHAQALLFVELLFEASLQAAALTVAWLLRTLAFPWVSVVAAGATAALLEWLWTRQKSTLLDWKQWREQRRVLGTSPLLLGLLGGMLAQLGPQHLLWVAPLLLLAQRQGQKRFLGLQVGDRDHLLRKSQQSQSELRQTQNQLQAQVSEASLLDLLTRRMLACEDLGEAVSAICQCTGQFLPCRSILLYLVEGSGWARVLGTDAELDQRQRELQQGRVSEFLQSSGPPQWLGQQAILPLESWGCLWVLREQGEFSTQERHLLNLLARQVCLGLQSVHRQTSLRQSLHYHQEWVSGLQQLLEGARILAACPEPLALKDRFRQICQALIPHSGGVLAIDQEEAWSWPEGPVPFAECPAPGFPGTLSRPLGDEEGRFGWVALWAAPGSNFPSDHQDLFQLLTLQFISAWRNSQLQRALAQSQAKVAQSSRLASVGQLAAGVAHELNTPLGAALMQVGQAQRNLERNPEKIPERLEKARQALLQARSIIEKLLLYSRESQSGRWRLNLAQLVRDTLDLYRTQIETEGVRITAEVLPDSWVEGNSNELQQVLLNLLLNARDALAEAVTKEVRIGLLASPDGSRQELHITDVGCGMTPEVQKEIFQPFFTTKPVGSGTGLGLAIVAEIVKQHRGEISVESQLGRGTRFRLSFPTSVEGGAKEVG